MSRTPTSSIWRSVVYAGAMLSTQVACPGGGGGVVCRPARAEEMPRSPMWDVVPAESPPPEGDEAESFSITLMSEPPGAQIFMDGDSIGVTPVQITVQPGSVELRAELDGHVSAPHSIDVDQDLDARITMVTDEEASRPTEICERRGRGFVLA